MKNPFSPPGPGRLRHSVTGRIFVLIGFLGFAACFAPKAAAQGNVRVRTAQYCFNQTSPTGGVEVYFEPDKPGATIKVTTGSDGEAWVRVPTGSWRVKADFHDNASLYVYNMSQSWATAPPDDLAQNVPSGTYVLYGVGSSYTDATPVNLTFTRWGCSNPQNNQRAVDLDHLQFLNDLLAQANGGKGTSYIFKDKYGFYTAIDKQTLAAFLVVLVTYGMAMPASNRTPIFAKAVIQIPAGLRDLQNETLQNIAQIQKERDDLQKKVNSGIY